MCHPSCNNATRILPDTPLDVLWYQFHRACSLPSHPIHRDIYPPQVGLYACQKCTGRRLRRLWAHTGMIPACRLGVFCNRILLFAADAVANTLGRPGRFIHPYRYACSKLSLSLNLRLRLWVPARCFATRAQTSGSSSHSFRMTSRRRSSGALSILEMVGLSFRDAIAFGLMCRVSEPVCGGWC